MTGIISEANFEAGAMFVDLPVLRGLEAAFFLNGSVEKACRNLARGKPNATVVGAPVVGESYTRFKGLTNFLQTEMNDSQFNTIYTVVRSQDTLADIDHSPAYYGTGGAGASGTNLVYASNDTVAFHGSHYSNAGGTSQTSLGASLIPANGDIEVNHWSIVVGIVGDMTNTSINATKGVKKTGPLATYPRALSPNKFRLGSLHTASAASSYKGELDMGCWIGCSVEHNDTEIAAMVEWLREYAAYKGLAGA